MIGEEGAVYLHCFLSQGKALLISLMVTAPPDTPIPWVFFTVSQSPSRLLTSFPADVLVLKRKLLVGLSRPKKTVLPLAPWCHTVLFMVTRFLRPHEKHSTTFSPVVGFTQLPGVLGPRLVPPQLTWLLRHMGLYFLPEHVHQLLLSQSNGWARLLLSLLSLCLSGESALWRAGKLSSIRTWGMRRLQGEGSLPTCGGRSLIAGGGHGWEGCPVAVLVCGCPGSWPAWGRTCQHATMPVKNFTQVLHALPDFPTLLNVKVSPSPDYLSSL